MIDIKFLRENPEIVKENIKKKFQDHKLVLVDEVIDLDQKNREVKLKGDNLRADRKNISAQIGELMKQGKKEEAEQVKAQVQKINDETKTGILLLVVLDLSHALCTHNNALFFFFFSFLFSVVMFKSDI